MTLKDLASQLKDEAQNGILSFDQLTLIVPPIGTLLEYYSEAQSLTLGGVEISFHVAENTLELKGSSPWATGLPLDFKMLITEVNKVLIVNVEVGMPADHKLDIPGLSWFTLSEAGLSLATLEPSIENELLHRYYKGSLHCTMQLGNTKIPLTAEYSGASELVLAADLTDIPFPSLTDLAQVVGGRNTISIPEQIDVLGNIQLKELEVTTSSSFGASKLANIRFSFGTKEAWEIVPGVFSIEKLIVEINVSRPLDLNRSFVGFIQGDIKVGEVNAILTAEKGFEGDWELKAEIPRIDFGSIATQALSGLPLPAQLPEISFENTALTIIPSTGDYHFVSQSAASNTWKIGIGSSSDFEIKSLKLHASRTNHQFEGFLEGKSELFGTEVMVSVKLDENLTIHSTISSINLSSIAEELLKTVKLPADLPDFKFENIDFTINSTTGEFMLSGTSTNDWKIPLGVTGLLIDTVTLSLKREKAANNRKAITGTLGGEVSIGGVEFNLTFSFPGDYKLEATVASLSLGAIIQDLCGTDALQGFPAPTNVLNLSLEDVKIAASPTKKSFSISGSSSLGAVEVLVSKDRSGKWGFAVAIAPADDWKFSSIDASLSALDDLVLNDTGLVLSSIDTNSLPLSIITIPEGKKITRGLVLISDLDLSNLGVGDLVNLESLNVSAAIGTKPSNLILEADMGGSFQLSENIAMGNMRFRLHPAPTNFSVGIAGSVMAKLDESELEFIGTMSVAPINRSASFAATMLGEWKEPYGTKGFSIGDLAIEIGVGIVPPPAVAAPIIGFAGTVSIGSFKGSVAVKLDTVIPTKSMVSAAFNQLFLKDIIQQFCDRNVYGNIPPEIRNTILDIGLEDVAVHIVPMPTQIGELFYEEGFRFQGNMNIGEFNAEFLFVLDYTKGFRIFAQMDEINIENIFIISGSGVQPKPTIDVNLMVGENPGIEIAGSIYLLGISSQVYININDTGFEFLIEGKIFNLFAASIQASGGNLKGGGDFYLKVQMRNDLVSFLREEAVKAIQNAAQEATNKINDAQNDIQYARSKIASIQQEIDKTRGDIVNERAKNTKAVESAQREVTNVENAVRELDTKIANMRNTVKAERARDTKKVKEAEKAVTTLQNKVKGLDTNITNMRAAIARERASDTKKLVAAQNEMTKAQRSVDSLQREINSSYSRINELRRNINSKKKWYDNSPWYKKSYRWAEYSAYAAAKGAEITALYTKIGGIEAAKVTAKGGLEAAKLVVKGIERGINTFPIDSDPRILSLFTAKEAANLSLSAANATLKAARSVITAFPIDADPRIVALFTGKTTTLGTLEIAKQTLRTAKALINTFPIDADPRILALFTAKESANATLIIANEFLEGIENAVGGMATVSTFIVEKGLGGLLDVKKAMFEGQLNAVKGGRVALALSLELMGKPHDLMLAFNFHSPLSGAKELGDKLLKMID